MKNYPDKDICKNYEGMHSNQSTRDAVEDAIDLSKDPDALWDSSFDNDIEPEPVTPVGKRPTTVPSPSRGLVPM